MNGWAKKRHFLSLIHCCIVLILTCLRCFLKLTAVLQMQKFKLGLALKKFYSFVSYYCFYSNHSTALIRCSASHDVRQWCSDPCVPEEDDNQDEQQSLSASKDTALSPEWSTMRKKAEDSVRHTMSLFKHFGF